MNEKFNKNAKVEKFINMLGTGVRLIVIDPLTLTMALLMKLQIPLLGAHFGVR